MKILLIGATGATGTELLPRLLAAGHSVTALVRSPDKFATHNDMLTIVPGQVQDAETMDAVVKGQDAVISAFGPRSFAKTDIQEVLMRNLVAAMKKHGVKRLVNLSAFGSSQTAQFIGVGMRIFRNTLLKNVFVDKENGEKILLASNLDYINVCPGRLLNAPARGNVKSSVDGKGLKFEMTRADLAEWMVAQLTSDIWVRKFAVIGY